MTNAQINLQENRPKHRYRLLFVAHSMKVGGAENTLYNIMRHLDQSLFEVHLASPQGPLLNSFRPFSKKIVKLTPGYLPMSFRPLAYFRSFYAFLINSIKIWFFLHRYPADLIFNNSGVILHGVFVARLFRIPSTTMIHEIILPGFVRKLIYFILERWSKKIIFLSDAAEKKIKGLETSSKFIKVPAAVEINGDKEVCIPDGGAIVRIPRGFSLVGLVGLVHPIKGIEYFLEMAHEITKKIKEVYFVVVGRYNPHSFFYRRMIRLRRRLNLDYHLVFTGEIQPIKGILECLDVLVVSSVNESLSLASLEAMTLEKPVVAFNVGGVSEVIEDGVTGKLIEFGNTQAMANAVISLIKDENLSARMGSKGRQRVEKNFNILKQKQGIEKIFLDILSETKEKRVGVS